MFKGEFKNTQSSIVATENEGSITTSLLNISYDEERVYKIPACKENARGSMYVSEYIFPGSRFEEKDIAFTKEGEYYCIKLPAHSMAIFVQE